MHRLLAIALLAIALPACDAEHDDPVTSIDSKYISRAARYHAMDEGVVVIDPNSPRVITMDPWPQLVFLMSDGQHTVSQIINHLVAGYNDGPPDGLADQVRSIVRDLQREGILRIHEEPETLPTEIATPVPPPNKDT